MNNVKIILGIESSCDETAAAILQKDGHKITILSNVIATSLEIQSKWGGVVPEQAAREQLKSIIPVITESLDQANLKKDDIDAIAVTQGPGLIGSLLVGVETAKTLSLLWKKPLIPVNHLIGHFYANWISTDSQLTTPSFPCIGLLVSGGHTDLVLFKNHGEYEYLGGTRDDAAGECFDKSARLLGFPYPGGPQISKQAQNGNPKAYNLPKPMLGSADLDFSFSGLKTAISYLVKELIEKGGPLSAKQIADLCATLEQTICDVLIKKTLKAAAQKNVKTIIVAGGVAANQALSNQLKAQSQQKSIEVFIPQPKLCTDNASMIASAAFFLNPIDDPLKLQANPNLSLST